MIKPCGQIFLMGFVYLFIFKLYGLFAILCLSPAGKFFFAGIFLFIDI